MQSEMLMNQQLEDGNFGSEQIKNNSSEEEPTGTLIKKELEVLVIRKVEQLIKPILEPMIRTVMKEEIRSALEKMLSSNKQNYGNEIHRSEQSSLRLRFLDEVCQNIMTKDQIKGQEGGSIKVDLFDDLTRKVVNSGPLASAKVEIVALMGDFDGDGEDWTHEEFNQKIVTELEGKRSLLTGKTFLNLREGVGVLDDFSFKQNSSWRKSCELRLGARVVDNILNGTRVREAKTERFNVKDRRNKLYKKHFPPSPDDEVWRLKNIGRHGAFHKRLIGIHIKTVKDFLAEYSKNPKRLQNILQASDKMWDTMVKHAKTCNLCPSPNSQSKIVVGQVVGIHSESQYVPSDGLPDTDKANASAYEHSNDIVSFDGETSVVHGSSCPPIVENLYNVNFVEACLPIAENPSNLSQREISSDCNSLTIYDYGYGQPNTSYGGANGLEYYSFDHGFGNNQSSLLVQGTNSSFCVPGSSNEPFLHQESSNFNYMFINTQNPNLESQGYLQSVGDGAMLKAQRKRTKYPKVLLRFISLQFVTLKRLRAAKRPRLC